jgi:uncharacterized protein YbaP (TraB family)
MKPIIAALLALFSLLAAPAGAAEAVQAPQSHPALWRVSGAHATVYLLGSVHILSPALNWRDGRIDAAIAASDTFYFETALDPAAIKQYIADKGTLPDGQSLRAMLPPDSQTDLDDDMASIGIPEAGLDTRRPWLATIAMIGLKYAKGGAPTGVDVQLMGDVKTLGKPVRYFETMEQQMALLAPGDPKDELESFEIFLKDFRKGGEDIGPIVDAWSAGDQKTLTRLLMSGFDKHPKARAMFFDDRNAAWAKTLGGVLDHESGTFFVTVGAGHLVTDRGVPALLKQAGYKVERL